MSCSSSDTNTILGTVEGKIHSIVNTFGDEVEYLFMNWAQANVAIDKITKPTIMYVLPPAGQLDVSWRGVKDYPQSQIGFLCSTEFDFEGEENDNLIESMKRLAMRFIRRLNESGLFEPIQGYVPYQVLYDHLDENVTGLVITPILREVEGVVMCQEPGARVEVENEY